MSEFKALIGELQTQLDTFAKAGAPCDDKDDDKKIVAAAGKEGAKAEGDDKEPDGDEAFGKAFKVTLADGSEAEAFDGTAMLKALMLENGELKESMGDFQKAFASAVDVIKQMRDGMAEQATMIKALQTTVGTLSAAPAGRRTMVTIAEKLTPGTPGAGEAANKPTAHGVMMKASQMCRSGALGWEALPRIEAFQGRGQLAPPDLLARFPELLTPAA